MHHIHTSSLHPLGVVGLTLVAWMTLSAAACNGDDGAPLGLVGPNGGTVTVGDASVVIPAGALSAATAINIVEVPSPPAPPPGYEPAGAVFAFTPHGTIFAVPATVTLPYTGSETGLGVFRLDDASDSTWEEVPGVTFSGGRATFQTTSFSLKGVFRLVTPVEPGPDAGRDTGDRPDAGGDLDTGDGVDAGDDVAPDGPSDVPADEVEGPREADCNTLDEFLVSLWQLELGVENFAGLTVGQVPEAPLPAGTTVVEDGFGDAEELSTTLDADTYFAYLNDAPEELFEHPVRYVFCEVGSEFTVVDALWPPLVDSESLVAREQGGEALLRLFATSNAEAQPLDDPVTDEAAPEADFGDAPDDEVDASYPTRFTRTGPSPGGHTLNIEHEWIGNGDPDDEDVSAEQGAMDEDDPDGDPNLDNADGFDDVKYLAVDLGDTEATARMLLWVAHAGDAPTADGFINILIDLNDDGDWGESAPIDEWVLQNDAVTGEIGAEVGVLTGAFRIDAGDVEAFPEVWMRTALTRDAIDAGGFADDHWDGSGAFAHGEIEDDLPALRPHGPPEDGNGDPPPPPPLEWGIPKLSFAIVLDGGDKGGESIVRDSANAMEHYLEGQGFDVQRVDSLAGLRAAVQALIPQLLCLDEVVIYMVAHGSRRGPRMSIGGMSVNQDDLTSILNLLVACEDKLCDTPREVCDVKVVVESCFSGNFSGLGGTGRTVVLSSMADQTSKVGCNTGIGNIASGIIANGLDNLDALNGHVQNELADCRRNGVGVSGQTMPPIMGMACDCDCPLIWFDDSLDDFLCWLLPVPEGGAEPVPFPEDAEIEQEDCDELIMFHWEWIPFELDDSGEVVEIPAVYIQIEAEKSVGQPLGEVPLNIDIALNFGSGAPIELPDFRGLHFADFELDAILQLGLNADLSTPSEPVGQGQANLETAEGVAPIEILSLELSSVDPITLTGPMTFDIVIPVSELPMLEGIDQLTLRPAPWACFVPTSDSGDFHCVDLPDAFGDPEDDLVVPVPPFGRGSVLLDSD